MKGTFFETEFNLQQDYTQIMNSQKVINQLYGALCDQFLEKHGTDNPQFDTLASLGEILEINSNHIEETSKKIQNVEKSIEQIRQDVMKKCQNQKLISDKKGQKPTLKGRKKRPYGFYSESIKLSAIQAIDEGKDVHVVAEQIGVNFKNIVRWKKQGYKRKVSKQPGNQPELEKELSEWLRDMIDKQEIVTMGQIKQKALSLSCEENFKASRDWMLRFLRTYKLLDKITVISNKQ